MDSYTEKKQRMVGNILVFPGAENKNGWVVFHKFQDI